MTVDWPTNTDLDIAIDALMETARSKAESEIRSDKAFDFEGNPLNGSVNEYDEEQIQEALDNLRARFDLTYTPHPNEFNTLIEAMSDVENAMGINIGDPDDLDQNLSKDERDSIKGKSGTDDLKAIDTAADEIGEHWDGQLRNNLVDNLDKMSSIAGNQGALAQFLRLQAELMQKVYARRRTDAKKIAEEGKSAIEAIKDCKGDDLAILLAVVIAIGTVGTGGAVLLPTTAGIVATLAGSSAIIGGTLGGPFLPEDTETPLGADTVEGVFDNIYQALNDSDKTMEDEEAEIMKALTEIESLVAPTLGESAYHGTAMVPAWPDMAKVSDPDEMRDKFTSWPKDGDHDSDGDGDGGGGGRGSWYGDDPPEDWDGSVFDPPGKNKNK